MMNWMRDAVDRLGHMHKWILPVVFLAAASAPLDATARSTGSPLPEPVAKVLARAGIPLSGVGVYVREVGTKQPVVAYGAGRSFNPASVMKLVTTYGALEFLGPAYSWNTEIYVSAPPAKDVLEGDLFIKGHGDPKLTLENFWLLLRNLRARGVRDIRGDLVLDHSYFGLGGYDPAKFDGEPARPYNTGPDALLVNFKAVTLQFVPDVERHALEIIPETILPQLHIVNNVKLRNGACGDWVTRLNIETHGNAGSARLALNGSYSPDCGERTRSFSVLGHREYFAALFGQLWKDLGGTLSGAVRYGKVPPDARLLLAWKSPSLSEVVRDINKFSNNVMARQLFLTLGAVGEGAPGTREKARQVLARWLATKGLTFPELKLDNGSGLSRSARISARSLGRLLIAAYESPVMPELMASLPLVAVDGTMRKRLSGADVAGHAHIKTGSLSGVRSIAGYVLDHRGRRMVVVFIVNDANAGNARPVQDALLKWVYNR